MYLEVQYCDVNERVIYTLQSGTYNLRKLLKRGQNMQKNSPYWVRHAEQYCHKIAHDI
jgi:hypothetical protein